MDEGAYQIAVIEVLYPRSISCLGGTGTYILAGNAGMSPILFAGVARRWDGGD